MGTNPKIITSTPKGRVITVHTKSGSVTARIEWNPGFGPRFTRQMQSGQAKFDMEVMKQMEPYMQLDSGAMINSMRLATDVGSGLIRVRTPYARRRYYERTRIGISKHPLGGPYYFLRMRADKHAYLRSFAAKVVGAK
ncbi:minor capsid protein [Clostridia bacterium OttesenSCG-928-O13]|nr:minor capsid protein [Clostridia bacterium OttesenSCG-928-O13]